MSRRLELHKILTDLLGSENVYFQPPSNAEMEYPCIVYRRDLVDGIYSNNRFYRGMQRYSITVIDPDPNSIIPSSILTLPLVKSNRHFTSDNLNHDVFTIYY